MYICDRHKKNVLSIHVFLICAIHKVTNNFFFSEQICNIETYCILDGVGETMEKDAEEECSGKWDL